MQKKLIALAVAGVASTAAFAQSNVTIYGTLQPSWDSMGVEGTSGRTSAMQSNNSNIGFKGEEALGNGLKAIFQIESGVGIGDTRTAAPQGGLLGGRDTWVGLSSQTFGSVTMGRRDTAFKTATNKLDLFADSVGDWNNIIGLGVSGSTFNERGNSSFNYVSPSFAGFQATASHSMNTQNATTAQDDNRSGLTGSYTNGGLYAVLAWEGAKGSAVGGTQDARAYRGGASYAFGPAKILGAYEQIKQTDTGPVSAKKRNAYYLGASYTVGAFDLLATYIHAGDQANGVAAGTDRKGATNYNLGARYNLSKRTNVLAIYTNLDNKGDSTNGGTYALDAGTGGTPAAGKDIAGFSVRVQHKF